MRLQRRGSRRTDRRSVLLVALNELQVRYLSEFRGVFDSDPRLSFFLTSRRRGRAAEPVRSRAAAVNLPFLERDHARRRWWDLAVFADHGGLERFPRLIPRLRIQHCMATGKRIGGEWYRYNPALCLDRRGRPVYECIFEASEAIRALAVAEVPALAGRIAVVGDLDADRLLARQGDREACRRELGLGPDDRVALIWSTWGPGALIRTMGEALLAEAERLQKEGPWRFVLSVHPEHWLAGGESFRAQVRGFEDRGLVVRPAGVSFYEPFVAADAMISDHTSLAAMYALLGKPLAFVPVGAEYLSPESTLGRLHALCPHVKSPADLEEVLDGDFPLAGMRELTDELTSEPGRAAERYRQETYDLLRLK
jgi:hypothetical protein